MRAYRLILEAPWLADEEQALNNDFEWTCFDQSVFVLSLEHFQVNLLTLDSRLMVYA